MFFFSRFMICVFYYWYFPVLPDNLKRTLDIVTEGNGPWYERLLMPVYWCPWACYLQWSSLRISAHWIYSYLYLYVCTVFTESFFTRWEIISLLWNWTVGRIETGIHIDSVSLVVYCRIVLIDSLWILSIICSELSFGTKYVLMKACNRITLWVIFFCSNKLR